jgi:hypothetical protein
VILIFGIKNVTKHFHTNVHLVAIKIIGNNVAYIVYVHEDLPCEANENVGAIKDMTFNEVAMHMLRTTVTTYFMVMHISDMFKIFFLSSNLCCQGITTSLVCFTFLAVKF